MFTPSAEQVAKQRKEKEEKEWLEKEENKQRVFEYEKGRIEIQKHLFKNNWLKFRDTLDEQDIFTLYHFTDKANIPLILKYGGLYSFKILQLKNIKIPKPNSTCESRQIDKQNGLDNYVRLSFTADNPMSHVAKKSGRIENPVVLKIDRILLYKKDTMFSNINAKSTENINVSFDAFQKINFLVFKRKYLDLEDYNKKFYMAEVLIKQKIPLRFITNISDFT